MALEVVDPRPPRPGRLLDIAEGRSPEGRRLVLLDNGSVGGTPFLGRLFDVIETRARAQGAVVVRLEHNLLALTAGQIATLVTSLAAQSDLLGVVVGLCDWGVSQPTCMVAIELEKADVPTCQIATEVGATYIRSVRAAYMPSLPLVQVTASHDATAEERLQAHADDIMRSVTAPDRRRSIGTGTSDGGMLADPEGVLRLDGADSAREFTSVMGRSGLGDGLPLFAPSVETVELFLAAAGSLTGDEAIWPAISPREGPVTSRQVAAVAVAAGCDPRSAEVVFTAFRAMAHDRFRLFQSAISTHPAGTLVLVSGPDAQRYGFATGRGSLGPGNRTSASTGRAVALGPSLLLGAIPGRTDLVAQGSPAEFSYCCAENLTDSPWPGVHADLGWDERTTVTVLQCEGPHNMVDIKSSQPTSLLETFASTMTSLGSNAAYLTGAETVLLLNPAHAGLLAGAGWTKTDVRRCLFELARQPRELLQSHGMPTSWPAWFGALDQVPVLADPSDLLVAVVGGTGPASQVAIPWGYSRAVTLPVSADPSEIAPTAR
jgi:hypothetical protein